MTKKHHSIKNMLQVTGGKLFMATLLSVLFKRDGGKSRHTLSPFWSPELIWKIALVPVISCICI